MRGNNRAQEGVQAAFEKKTLFRAIDDAVKLKVISGAVGATAKFFIRFIPEDALSAISPVRVNRAADELSIDVRTVRRHTGNLINLGMAENKTLDGGHRVAYRNLNGVTYIAGIDFSPLLKMAEQLSQGVTEFEAELQAKMSLCARISTLRRDIRAGLDASPSMPEELKERFIAFPRRLTALSIDAIENIFVAVEALYEEVCSFLNYEMSDQSDSNVRLYTTSKKSFGKSNRSPIKKAEKDLGSEVGGATENLADQERQVSDKAATQTETDTPTILQDTKLLLGIAPANWQEDLYELNPDPDWLEFHAMAKTRASANGIWPEKFDELVDIHGLPIMCFLMILVDHNGPAGRGQIKKPVGWVLSMHKRLLEGNANLTKSLFGLIERLKNSG
ncbi:MAG: helix-turn-helix domain-containing protein [Pseudomonadota bacterium]